MSEINNSDKKENPQEAQLCLRNCGFYGNPKTNGLCSSCFQKEGTSLRQQLLQSNDNISSNSENLQESQGQQSQPQPQQTKEESPKGNKKRTIDYLEYMNGLDGRARNSNTNRLINEDKLNSVASTSAPAVVFTPPPVTSTTTTTISTNNDNSGNVGTTLSATPNTTTSPLKILKHEINNNNNTQFSSSEGTLKPSADSPFSSSPLSSSPSKSNIKCKFPSCGKSISSSLSLSSKCRCGEYFCGKHIHNHNCTFDYKSLAKSNIAKANPQILANKIVKL
ncbi:hypothetical protein DICPUDRAFT_92931 [Dictyostelium purpureum]|uniref:A20-type domain-containing protein n=1 Tax=Dictyostelium purpureum TaxID=5786 RepID=F0ZZF2_DICPU|nr:uncharacterized protein DICPUDRAFT_92931 [Dictyostelium purpureum]EGC30676.1 hypothetical protein DICPUDRAFT_92931 [Dictyostelium purpureum]|eukprot:XP_003292801.1 hypothetical protein DICPUDRAFT_92931 [Dictyostelium purpureum]